MAILSECEGINMKEYQSRYSSTKYTFNNNLHKKYKVSLQALNGYVRTFN
jgi:hypothetical protein